MKYVLTIVHWFIFASFVAMKVAGGILWSWWWLLMPLVPVLAELFRFAQRNGVVR